MLSLIWRKKIYFKSLYFILIVSVCECMHIHAHVLLCMTATATESRSEDYIPQRLNYRQLSWCGARNRIPVLWKRRDSESPSISLAHSCILKVEKKPTYINIPFKFNTETSLWNFMSYYLSFVFANIDTKLLVMHIGIFLKTLNIIKSGSLWFREIII